MSQRQEPCQIQISSLDRNTWKPIEKNISHLNSIYLRLKSFRLKRTFVISLTCSLILGCSPQNQNGDPDTKRYYQVQEEAVIIKTQDQDTIETGVPLPFDWEGKRIEVSVPFLAGLGGDIPTKKFVLDSNSDSIIYGKATAYDIDSSILISPELDTAIKPPRLLFVDPVEHLAISPERKKVDHPVYKDNAHYDILCVSTDQGLPSNEIQDIKLDSRGYLWLGTDRGLALYDGRFVTTYNTKHGLPEDFITCIEEDKEGNLWMGTRSEGIVKFDGMSFYHYDTDSIAPKREIKNIAFDHDGNLWCAIQFGGFAKYDGEKFHIYQQAQGVVGNRPTTAVTVDNANNVWVSNFGHGSYRITPDGELRRVTGKLGADLHSNWTNHVYRTSKDELIWSRWGGYFTVLTADRDSSFGMNLSNVGEPLLISNVQEDADGNLWLSGYGDGLYHWNRETDIVTRIGQEEGMSNPFVGMMEVDEHEGIWVGMEQAGLCYVKPKSFKRNNHDNGFDFDVVMDIYEAANGDMYYATTNGVVKEDSSGMTLFDFAKSNPSDVLLDSRGSLWYTSQNGGATLVRSDMTGARFARYGGPYNPTAVDTTSDGEVWIIGMNADLLQIDGDSVFRSYSMSNNLLTQQVEDMLITDDDVFWFGSSHSGVSMIKGDSITYFTTDDHLNSSVVYELSEDRLGRIWIGTEKGLNYYENGELKSLQTSNKILSGFIKGIVQDHQDRYWIASNTGLAALVPNVALQEEFNLDDFTIYEFDKTNGLPVMSFMADAIHVDSRNVLRIGTREGLLIQDLNEVNLNPSSPTAILNGLHINGKAIDFRQLKENGSIEDFEGSDDIRFGNIQPFWNFPDELELPHHLNHITFEFSGFNWKDPHSLEIQYYLEGYEGKWNKSREENIADYRNLSYGDYIFHLKSVSRDGRESEEFSYAFTIMRPWWHAWWARIMYVLILAGSVYLIIRRRTAALKQRQLELESQIARATVKISAQKDMAERQKDEIEKAHDELNIKNKEVLDSINYAKRIQSAILPSEKLVLEKLPNSFIIYKPKDIVAGDFYWMEPTNGSIFFAAADCTGHGVPGAMVSVICNNALNRSVREHKLEDPAKILDKTRQIVLEEFGQSEEGVNDGMDIALCKLTPKDEGYELEYAGAHNPLWIVREDKEAEEGFTLEEIKADKQPIGRFHDPKPFTKHIVKLGKGDSFYIFTDGFSDQFGGEKGKKFKTANFKKLIVKVQNQAIEKQGESLNNMFEEWKSDFEQLDDVCVIGVRI
jgi:ligand-binding sensor domain-containing protein/serine phosphatase RsbU (regulator of sigma subunit)